ncbi:16S rRNA (cytosine(967)-C(5))-methyltransferase RsmB [Halomonas sp. HNIBRBA4712]|uniref:16S rRNA (cytosine(967)-C(5))-methyltransferase RsmB n=1 Tax=Halomonas sp. HNIBRBA4712 TaxID=3373087 RepID=UPI0037468466
MSAKRPQKGSGQEVRAAAARALAIVLGERGSLASLDEHSVIARDRGLLKELCFGSCRRLPRLEAIAAKLLKQPFKKRDQDVQALLLIGIYQLLYMRIPAHAAVGETAGAARLLKKEWATRVLNGCLRRLQRESETLTEEVDRDESARLEHPAWLLSALKSAWPEQWPGIVAANNEPGPMTLRVNQRENDREAYLGKLLDQGLEAHLCPHAPDGITLETPCDVTTLPGFEQGLVSVQDEAAQLCATLLGPSIAPRPGARVLDACAAPGGKTAHLLEQFDIALTALDSDNQRLARVDDTLGRLHLEAELIHADAAKRDWWNGTLFDAILLDAPCSGTGVIRRHPDIKTLRRKSDIGKLTKLQAALLDNLWGLLRPGGTLLYATCSVLPEENERQLEAFVARTADARVTTPTDVAWGEARGHGRQLFSQQNSHDGFFYARLEKRPVDSGA